MVQKFLAALDGSAASESILPYLESLLAAQDADVTLTQVVPTPEAADVEKAHRYLHPLAAVLREKGLVVDVCVATGKPADALIDLAKQGGYSMILMCSKARTGLPRLIYGSVAEDVLRRSPVPVLVVHPQAPGQEKPRLKRIVVPLDGSHRSGSILQHVAPLAKATGSKLLFVTVVDPRAKDAMPVEVIARNLFREQKQLHRQGLQTELLIRYGDPAAEILSSGDDQHADLVALSTHGRTGLDRALYGSVAESILREGRLPLLVLRTAGTYEYDPMHATQIRAEREKERALGH